MRWLCCLLALVLGACRPPEADRTRGGGHGGDGGNHRDDLVIHGDRSPFYGTPIRSAPTSTAAARGGR